MSARKIAFAVPGKITDLTGGTIYDRRVMAELQALGLDVGLLELPGSFPDPSPRDMARALAQLGGVAADVPLIVDGLAFGALDPEGVAALRAPLVALVHHPLAEEGGLSRARRAALLHSERANLARAAHVIVPSPHTSRMLVDHYGVAQDRITIALPGTDRPRTEARPADPPLILAVGIQVPRKGHDVLIAALAGVRDLDWQARLVGAPRDAAFAAKLSAEVEAAGLADRITLCGQVEPPALDEHYAAASIFALATRYEGYGMAFAEALAHGLPIVTCATGAVPDTVPEGAGLLVPPDRPDDFARALRHMLSDDAFRKTRAAAARQAGTALPGWAQTAGVIAGALESSGVMAKGRPAP